MADSYLELREGGGVLIYLACWPFCLQSFLPFFLTKIRRGGRAHRAPPLDLPLLKSLHHPSEDGAKQDALSGVQGREIELTVKYNAHIKTPFGTYIRIKQ